MTLLKRNYWSVTSGSFINFLAKILLLVVSLVLVFKVDEIGEPLFTLIAYLILTLSLFWILGLVYFFQKISIDSKQGLVIQNFLFFKTNIPLKNIKSVSIFRTFFDKRFDTYSLKVSFLDEDEDEDEIILYGFDESSVKFLTEKFDEKLNLIFATSFPNKDKERKSMKSKSEKEAYAYLETLEKRFKIVWMFNIVLVVLVVLLFVFFMTDSHLQIGDAKATQISDVFSESKGYSKIFVFNETPSMKPVHFYETDDGKFAIELEIPPTFYESANSFVLALRSNDEEVFQYFFDLEQYAPIKIQGSCLKPGIINTSSLEPGGFKIIFDYLIDQPRCKNVDHVSIDFNVTGSIVSLVGVLQS